MNLTLEFLHLITIISCIICVFGYCMAASVFWKPHMPRFLFCLSGALIIGFSIWGVAQTENEISGYIILFGAEVFFLKIAANITWLQAVFAGLSSVFHTVCIKGITVGGFALILQKNLYQVITVKNWALEVLIVTMILKMLVLLAYRSEMIRLKLRTLFSSEQELLRVSYLQGGLFVFMLFYCYNYYYNLDLIWFTIAQILHSALMLILYNLILNYGSRISFFLENEVRKDIMSRQFHAQSAQYLSYQNTFHEIETFRHTFREATLSIQYLMENGNIQEASVLIQNTLSTITDNLPKKKEYSNLDVVNAFMLEWDHQCMKLGMQLESLIFVPDELYAKQEGILLILSELREIYMALGESVSNAEIKMQGKKVQNRFVIYTTGPYKGIVNSKGDMPEFTVANGMRANTGHQRLLTLIRSMDGTLFWDVSNLSPAFKITLSIHI